MSSPLQVPYVVVDVFTQTQFGGNQLAVITDGRGLSDDQMQRIANEFNFSETTFVLPASDTANTARVRIFNRTHEMPFAGHPNVGTAFVLGRQGEVLGQPVSGALRFEEMAGLVTVALESAAGEVRGATIDAPRALAVGKTFDAAAMAKCLGLTPAEIRLNHHAPTEVSVGIEFVVVEVEPGAVSRMAMNLDAFRATADRGDGTYGRLSVFAYARVGAGMEKLRARMFAPLAGTFEDPATGSASGALGAYLAWLDPRADGEYRIVIEQGVDMGRPSEINLRVSKSGGQVKSVKISGRCVHVMRGVLELA
ncbi:MAG: PhzF family phenazine biosynthesis protein [Steroidobacteraceae bacterium]